MEERESSLRQQALAEEAARRKAEEETLQLHQAVNAERDEKERLAVLLVRRISVFFVVLKWGLLMHH